MEKSLDGEDLPEIDAYTHTPLVYSVYLAAGCVCVFGGGSADDEGIQLALPSVGRLCTCSHTTAGRELASLLTFPRRL